MPLDDGRITETCCGNNIGGGEEELLRWRTHNCFDNLSRLVMRGFPEAERLAVRRPLTKATVPGP
jgi:hypothetical protein